MPSVSIATILCSTDLLNTDITAHGWVRTRRDSKAGFSFLTIYDGSCFECLQVIISNSLANYQDEILRLTTGCSIEVDGTVVISPAKGQQLELKATEIRVIGWIEDPDSYPIAAKHHSVEHLREVSHLRARTNLIGAVSRIRNTLFYAIHNYFHQAGYLWIATPIVTASDAEGAGEMFRVSTLDLENLPRTPEGRVDFNQDFFAQEAFLTVSGQLNVETYACALSKVYTFGPTFRAEKSNTTRHLAEFWMVEPELAFANLTDAIQLAEKLLKHVFQSVLDACESDIAFFDEHFHGNLVTRLMNFINSNFIEIDYQEAIHILKNCGEIFKDPIFWGVDLTSEHERYLAERYFQSPVVIKNYPKENKAFYMRLNDDEKTVAAMDVLVPGIGEIIGGSQREERLKILDLRMTELGIKKDTYWWYRDLRRYGTVPHAGFGLGFERLVAYVTGIQNIRDVIPFPRTPRNVLF